jgi:hypothetical protein
MPATGLHISGLHRDAGSWITSTTLPESLRFDRERCMASDELLAPYIAVVSGGLRIAWLQTCWMFTMFDTAALPHFERPVEFVAAYDRFLAGVAAG